MQQEGQTVEVYINFLRKKSITCKFGSYLDEAITNLIICGVRDNNLKKRLLAVDDLNLEKAIQISLQHESVKRDSYLLESTLRLASNSSIDIKEIARTGATRKGYNKEGQDRSQIVNCMYCGRNHKRGACPVSGQKYLRCGKVGHFRIKYKNNQVYRVRHEQNVNSGVLTVANETESHAVNGIQFGLGLLGKLY